MNIFKVLIIVSIAFMVIACGGAEERKAAYMEKAEKSLNAGDLDKARIELKNVLQIDPKDAQAYFKLGNIFERKKEFRKHLVITTRRLNWIRRTLSTRQKLVVFTWFWQVISKKLLRKWS